MKKVIHLLSRKKRMAVITNNVEADAVPDAPRNSFKYISIPTELCVNFNIDDCCDKSNSESNYISNTVQQETPELNIYEENTNHLDEELTPVEEITRSFQSDLVEGNENLPVVCVQQESDIITNSESNTFSTTSSLSSVGTETGSIPLNDIKLEGLKEAVQQLSNDISKEKMCGDKKKSGNTFLITISNSAHFHIGSQKTVNYPGADGNIYEKGQLKLTDLKYEKYLPVKDSQLVDIKDELSEDDLVVISLSVREKWRDFVRNLGVDESTIRELEDLNDDNYNLIVYDILRRYLTRYPNTTVGYIINLLKKSDETFAVEKLLEKR